VNIFGADIFNSENKIKEIKFKEIKITKKPFEVFAKINKKYNNAYIFESLIGPKKLSEYSYIGFDPKITISLNDDSVLFKKKDDIVTEKKLDKDIFHELKLLLENNKVTNNKNRLTGGLIGYLSYDIITKIEKIKQNNKEIDFPEYEFGLFDKGIVFDHLNSKIYYYYSEKDNFDEINDVLKSDSEIKNISISKPKSNLSKTEFEEIVKKGKEYVNSGDVFQVVLSKRYEFEINGDLLSFYKCLRDVNPSPYMYYLKLGERTIIGSSPEMLMRVTSNKIETFPIAGTRPITENPKINNILKKELIEDAKENAEHVMLVDLARNDVGKVAEFGSVNVPEFRKIHEFSHVQHIVSKVTGNLAQHQNVFDAVSSIFPAGTVSGAPKVRAMEIIDELEQTNRGPYAGALGYFSLNSCADFAITIRSLIVNKQKGYIQSGAGIVADSVPEKEWEETEHKASAMLSALEKASEM